MYSPRKSDFFKRFAQSIRFERMVQAREHEEAAAELLALQGRLRRLSMWEQLEVQGDCIRRCASV